MVMILPTMKSNYRYLGTRPVKGFQTLAKNSMLVHVLFAVVCSSCEMHRASLALIAWVPSSKYAATLWQLNIFEGRSCMLGVVADKWNILLN